MKKKRKERDGCYKDFRVITTNHQNVLYLNPDANEQSKRKQMTSARQLEIEY